MANTPSANYSPAFQKAGLSSDPVDVTTGTVMPNALDTHDHTSGKGLPVGRLAVAVAYTLGTEILGDGAITSFDFNPVPTGYRNLEIVVYARSNVAAQLSDTVNVRFNGDSGANYNVEEASAVNNAWTVQAATGLTGILATSFPAATATANYYSMQRILIPNYANTANFKVCHITGMAFFTAAGANMQVIHFGGQWLSTAAITRVQVVATTGPIATGSVATLYAF